MQQLWKLLVSGIKIPQSIKVNCGVRYSVTLLVEESSSAAFTHFLAAFAPGLTPPLRFTNKTVFSAVILEPMYVTTSLIGTSENTGK